MTDRRLLLLALLAAVAIAAFMTIGLAGNIAFVLKLRALRLLALVEIAASIAIATVVFQTITANRILTPSIMGLDALYVFGQTLLVFVLGGLGYATLDPALKFSAETMFMAGLALCLLLPILRLKSDLHLMLLAGVVLGVFFRSLSLLLARLIDPNDFAVVQGASFANFNTLRTDLTLAGTLVTIAAGFIVWRSRHLLDVIALGRDAAIGLGIDWMRTITGLLLLVVVLVAVSTALVGPVALFGLLVAALAERIVGTGRHATLLPAAILVAVVVLVGGQTVLQHSLGNASTLGVVIEFLGGLVFLALLLSRYRS